MADGWSGAGRASSGWPSPRHDRPPPRGRDLVGDIGEHVEEASRTAAFSLTQQGNQPRHDLPPVARQQLAGERPSLLVVAGRRGKARLISEAASQTGRGQHTNAIGPQREKSASSSSHRNPSGSEVPGGRDRTGTGNGWRPRRAGRSRPLRPSRACAMVFMRDARQQQRRGRAMPLLDLGRGGLRVRMVSKKLL